MELRDEITEKTWNSGKGKDENTRAENYFIMNNLRKKRIESSRGNKDKIYVMRILHQFKLMTSNGFGILLILVERIKRDIAQT